MLKHVRDKLTLESEAADSWVRMENARGARLSVNRSTVPRAVQMGMFNAWNAYVAGRGPKPDHGRAVHPDESWHCEPIAKAVDTNDDKWIREHPEHGWRFVVRDERWHAQYYEYLDKFAGTGTGGEKDDEMVAKTPPPPVVQVKQSNVGDQPWYVLNVMDGTYWMIDNLTQKRILVEMGEVREIHGLQPPELLVGMNKVRR